MPLNLPDHLRARMDKLKGLAERGVGGERRAAQAQLDRIMRELGLVPSDVFSQQREYATYSVRNKHEVTLLLQITGKVTRLNTVEYVMASSRSVWLMGSPDEHVLIRQIFTQHRAPLDEHLARAAMAYALAHDLQPPTSGTTITDPVELARLIRMMDSLSLPDPAALPAPSRALPE